MFTKVEPKIGQIVKTGGERYDAYNASSTALKAGDAVELAEVKFGRIGVQKLDSGECIGFVVSENIDREFAEGDEFTYASSHSFIALNAVGAIEVGDKVVPATGGVEVATEPDEGPPVVAGNLDKVVGTAYSDAADGEIVIIKLSVN